MEDSEVPLPRAGRRAFLKLAGGAGLAAGLGAVASACAEETVPFTGRPLVIAYNGMQSGSLAAVGEADPFVVNQVREHLRDGLEIGGRRHPVEIVTLDNQSDLERAGEVTAGLLRRRRVDLVLASGLTPTVAETCEAAGVPCVTTLLPYESHHLARQSLTGARRPPKRWAYHFFWGLRQGWDVYIDLWGQVGTNKVVGLLLPDDPDGRIWADPERGFGAVLRRRGFEQVVSRGLHEVGLPSFREDIRLFKAAKAEIVGGLLYPPDFATFWKQCEELDYRPRVVTMGRALLSPAFLEAVTPSPAGATTDVWWSPMHPFRSSLTGQSSQELASDYSATTLKQWIQPLGFTHALFEIAIAALRRANTADDPSAVVGALARGRFDTLVGPVDWTGGERKPAGMPPNAAATPLVGGQWRRRRGGDADPLELAIVNTADDLQIPDSGQVRPL